MWEERELVDDDGARSGKGASMGRFDRRTRDRDPRAAKGASALF